MSKKEKRAAIAVLWRMAMHVLRGGSWEVSSVRNPVKGFNVTFRTYKANDERNMSESQPADHDPFDD